MDRMLDRIARSLPLAAALLGTLFGLGASAPARAGDKLTLRVNQAIGEPGGVVAVVVRTYAPRAIEQGQVCFRSGFGRRLTTGDAALAPAEAVDAARARPTAESPFAELTGFRVFSDVGDAVSSASFDGTLALLNFASPSASVNRSDGPLAVLYFRLKDTLAPRQRFEVEIDLANTFLVDAAGDEVTLRPKAGRLTVRAPGDPFKVEADGDTVAPGAVAELGVMTFEPVAMGAGQVAFHYDPTVAAAPPTVRMDPRYGASAFTVDADTPGLVLISFTSPDGSFNSVPGQIVSLALPTRADVPAGTVTPVWLDSAATFFVDPAGGALPFTFEAGELSFR